jgi:DNA-directed RNA polymerase subunit F
MTVPDIKGEKPLNFYDVKHHLKAIKKRDETLSFRAQKTQEYIEQFTPLSEKKAQEVFEEIEKMQISRMKPEIIQKIIDMNPTSADDVKTLCSGYGLSLKNDVASDIAKLFSK